jgi:hypothetical protein
LPVRSDYYAREAGRTAIMSEFNKEFDELNGSRAVRLTQAEAERKKGTIIAVVVFCLFVIVGSITAMPSKGVRKKSELIFTTALIVVVGIGVAVSVKVSLNKKVKEKLGEDLNRSNS